MRQRVHTVKHDGPVTLSFHIPVAEFDRIVDEGYDIISIVTVKGRFTAGVDEWQDYGYYDVEPGATNVDPDVEVIRLNKAYMGRA